MVIEALASATEVSELLRQAASVDIVGADTNRKFRQPISAQTILSLKNVRGILEYEPQDQVVAIAAGTPLIELIAELETKQQTIPIGNPSGTVGGSLSMNLPHKLEATHGSWPDWVLGLEIVLADGTIAKVGSRAVKNVAGYDLHRFLVGSRGTLAVITKVILRTCALPLPEPEILGNTSLTDYRLIQRVWPSDFDKAWPWFDQKFSKACKETATIWTQSENPPRFDGDWIVSGESSIEDSVQVEWMRWAKAAFDPNHKLNPGEFGL